ncbi:uncharacterized protein [Onthophagus taurus]|uniref:uncharacterized protein n=1 Tax=Onthophagus taurus TaxID=166361 RepID=UPI000C201EE9|nr:uncharacterized protein LOC111414423 [Onthophagus taurus]
MIFKYILFATSFLCVHAGSSYQYINFQKPSSSQSKPSKLAYLRSSKGYALEDRYRGRINNNQPVQNHGLLQQPDNFAGFDTIPKDLNNLSYEINEIYDPYLLTGNAAKQASRFLYGRGPLFFGQYPHVKALLRNQEKRQANGLAGNRLGSLRPNSPFHRYEKPHYFNWYI